MKRLVVFALILSGCVSVRPRQAANDLRQLVAERSEAPVVWRTDAAADARADSAVAALLGDSLTADAAVQVSLLHNRRLQATYEDLGVAQASLVQAGLLRNPVFGARALWGLDEGGAPDLGFSAAFDFLNVFALPLRRAVARSEYDAARLRVAQAVLAQAARTRRAVTHVQAARLQRDMQTRIVAGAEAAYQAAVLLREAGNVPAVELLVEQERFESARLALVEADLAVAESREALTRELGLSAPDIRLAGLLAPVPDDEPVAQADTRTDGQIDVTALERRALDASLALAASRADAETAARRLGLGDLEAVLPDLEIGGELEREEGEWKAGPEVELALPLFDQGQARRAATWSALRRARAEYAATAVDVRSAARVLAARLAARRRVALQHQRVLLALRAELSAQTLRQYNAMQTGVFGLLQAQQNEARGARAYADALAAYWNARTDLDALFQGILPADLGDASMPAARSMAPARGADH